MKWPFADPPNVAVLTSRDVIDSGMPIIHVFHDADDGVWQFHSVHGAPEREADARVVALSTILEIDPRVALLADLPLGWVAHRDGPTDPWRRERVES